MSLPNKSPSVVAAAQSSPSTKVTQTSPDISNILHIKQITQDLLAQYFPRLSAAPNILYIAMAIWGFESSFKLWHKSGSVYSSRHLTAVNPATSSLVGRGYYYTQPIQNLLLSPTLTPTIKNNIDDGKYAQGISACMGCYHVRGTLNYNTEFLPFKNVVDAEGLAVNPGESITAIFPNNDTGIRRSIAAGLIILDFKYGIGLSKFSSNSDAIKYAVGIYLGKAGSVDANGTSPEQRVANVYNNRTSITSLLASAGISLDPNVQSITNSPASSVANQGDTSNTENRTASNTNTADPTSLPGCSS